MKVLDVQQWSMQEHAFDQDETGRQFLRYMTFWVDTAEKLLEEVPDSRPYDALQEALVVTEEEIGIMDAGMYLGQMLAFIIGNWIYGNAVVDALTNVEMKLLTSHVQERMQKMEAMAEENSQPKV